MAKRQSKTTTTSRSEKPNYIRTEDPDIGVEERDFERKQHSSERSDESSAEARSSHRSTNLTGELQDLMSKLEELDDNLSLDMEVIERRMARWSERSGKAIETTISQASKEAFWNKCVRFKANVIAKAPSPYLVPRKVKVNCGGPLDRRCASCSVNAAPGKIIEIDLMQEQVISLIDTPKTAIRQVVASAAEIPGNCKVWGIEIEEKASIQDLLVTGTFSSLRSIDEIDATRRVLFHGHDIQTNAVYSMQGTVFSNPKNNEAVYMVNLADPEDDDILDVQITEEMKRSVKLFQPKAPNDPRSIKHKLEEIYSDLSDNVTKIYGRYALHFLIDLGFHSAICWRWESDKKDAAYKGTTEILVVGDSGQGKSETMMRLRDHYGRGERIDCKSASYAGLVGGLEKYGDRFYMIWGRIPQNDRGAVILDEVKGMPTELVAQLTDLRSSQIAIVTRVGGTRRTTARVRYFWLSNPRGKLRMNEYGHGVASLTDLIGASEDIRRFDAAIIVSSGEVAQDFIDKKIIASNPVPHKYRKEACRNLLTICWSRTETIISNEVKKHIVQEATKLAEKYSPQIPLLEPADARRKLTRLAIALAGRVGSFTSDWSGVLVNKAHVDVVVEFLQEIYDSENFAFDRWSENQRRETTAEDSETDEILTMIRSVKNPLAFVETISSLDWLPKDIIINACSNDKEKADEVISTFIRSHYLTRYRSSYRKTPKMIALLRKIRDQELVNSFSTTSIDPDNDDDLF